MRRSVLNHGVLALLVLGVACDRLAEDRKKPMTVAYLSFTDYGCGGESGLAKRSQSEKPYLANHRMSGDTVTLTIHHSANCCPVFVDSISIHENAVDISVEDTLHGCRCMCEYENDFAFLYPGGETLRVRFGLDGKPFELDTLIQLP